MNYFTNKNIATIAGHWEYYRLIVSLSSSRGLVSSDLSNIMSVPSSELPHDYNVE